MRSKVSTVFKYIDKKRSETAVLIPGWATDYRIFGNLELGRNYLVPVRFSPMDFEEKLARELKKRKIKKATLFGYSLGGFIAANFASKYPELVDELILVGIREGYSKLEIKRVKESLKKNKKAYLYKFYNRCFNDETRRATFKKGLMKDYLKEFELDYLLETLDYLGNLIFLPGIINEIKKVRIVHGEKDRIAPISGAMKIKKRLPRAGFINVKGAGHIPFYG